jgi:hypothetical protein
VKRAKVKPEEKPITAQLPDGATTFDALAPIYVDKRGVTTGHRILPGCYRVPPKRPSE